MVILKPTRERTLPGYNPMLVPNMVMYTLPVPGLLVGIAFDKTTVLYVKAFVEEPRSKTTETIAEMLDAEPRTLFDIRHDSETQFVVENAVRPTFDLEVHPTSPKPAPMTVTDTLPLVGAFKPTERFDWTVGAL